MTTPATKRDLYKNALNTAERTLAIAEKHGLKREAHIVTHALRQCVEHENERFLYALQRMKPTPVTIDEFMSSESPFGNSGMGNFRASFPPMATRIIAVETSMRRCYQASRLRPPHHRSCTRLHRRRPT